MNQDSKTNEPTEKYREVISQAVYLLSDGNPVLTNLSNLTALLKRSFSKISWVGFYIADGEKLYLGPFQGDVACEVIDFGSGVCGVSAKKEETVIVENVDEFSGHIACDANTNSEIVVPVVVNGKVFAVLDLDSYDYSAFNETDKYYLEKIVEILKKNVTLEKFNLT